MILIITGSNMACNASFGSKLDSTKWTQ